MRLEIVRISTCVEFRTNVFLTKRIIYPYLGHGDPMDFWDHSLWWLIPQNDHNASEPTVLTPHLIQHVLPDIKLILMLRDPVERYSSIST